MQQIGTPDEIYNRPANTFVGRFMGSPSMNLLTRWCAAAPDVAGRRSLRFPRPTVRPPSGAARHLRGAPSSVHGTLPPGSTPRPLGSHIWSTHWWRCPTAPRPALWCTPPDTVLKRRQLRQPEVNPEKAYLFDAVTGSAQLTRERISLV